LLTDVKNISSNIMNKKKTPVTLVVVMILLSCFLVMATATAQTSQSMQPPDFNGGAPPDWSGNGNMTMPPPDFNGSSGFGNGGMPMPDFNGTMPRTSGNPGNLNGQLNPQVSGNQTNYTLYVIAGVGVVAVVAVISVVLIQKRKSRLPVPIVS
jgi:preprotein translocase subunit SecG